jgi:ribosomal protein S6--L-glutamate ligase
MKVGFITFRHPSPRNSPVMPDLVRALVSRGATVEIIYPEERLTNLGSISIEHDLYILRSDSQLALSYAGALHMMGARIINPFAVSAIMRDKIMATRVLMNAGIPVPETYFGAHRKQFAPLLDRPLVLKSPDGSHGSGVRIIWDADELDAFGADEIPRFAQRFHPAEGEDRRIYCIGGELFGVLRTRPAKSYDDNFGRPFILGPEMSDLAHKVGAAFGVDLFGIDVIISGGKPLVLDVQSFPSFTGLAGAAQRLADYIIRVMQSAPAGKEQLASPRESASA